MNTDTLQAISRLDFVTRKIELLHIYDHLHRNSEGEIREKNWGFVQTDRKHVHIFYSVLPCTVVLVLGMDESNAFQSNTKSSEPSLKRLTSHKSQCVDVSRREQIYSDGQSLLDFREAMVHGSGHPIVWEYEGSREYLALIHDKDYCHYAVRIKFASLKVSQIGPIALLVFPGMILLSISIETVKLTSQASHVSEEPLICPSDFEHEGLRDLLTIGSYHLSASQNGYVLWVFMGLGDTFACRHPLSLNRVKWARFAHVQEQDTDQLANISVMTVPQGTL